MPSGGWTPRDGDATYLPVGTAVHAVVGVDRSDEVVVLDDDGPTLYRQLGPTADTAGDGDVPVPPEE